MDFLEKDLEEIIFNADKDLLAEKGLYVSGILKRQLRVGNYGTADLVTFERNYNERAMFNNIFYPELRVTVYELKKKNINISAFLQALGYVKGLKRYFEKRNFAFNIIFEIVLIGRNIDKNSNFVYLPDFLHNKDMSDFLNLYIYSFDINGICFENINGYCLNDEGF